MEIDLIRYRNKFKTEKSSDNAVFMKISRKFAAKGYPNISRKSIKYKYEKLQTADRFREIEAEAAMHVVESDDDVEVTTSGKKQQPVKKNYCTWDEEMEVMLVNLVTRIRVDQPAISDNSLFRRVTRDMQIEGYLNLTDHIVLYHFRKLKQDNPKFLRLMEQSKLFDEAPTDEWSKPADTALLHYHNKLKASDLSLRPLEIYAKVKQQLEDAGVGSFSEISIRNRILSFPRDVDDSEDSEHQNGDNSKRRNYLYWTEDMKEALMKYRRLLKERPGLGDLWENVAKMMRSDGYGDFTADNVRYKYFNLKRRKENVTAVEGMENDEM
jgi:hypothetical protein